MSFNQTNPNFANYQNSQLQAQGINPAPFPQIPYKPITFEKLSNLIGITYNLSAIENINTIPLPRGSGEQQIFFVNNDEKIYARSFDNSIGVVGYKQDYVQKLEDDLKEAQSQLQEIFNEIIGPSVEEPVTLLGSPCCSPSNNLRSINGTTPTPAPTLARVEEAAPSVQNTKSVENRNGK